MTRLSLILALLASPAFGQQSCATRDIVIERLSTGYGETLQGGGLQSETKIFEVWFSEESGTWTILMTKANGTSCVMASGTNWRGPGPNDQLIPGVPG